LFRKTGRGSIETELPVSEIDFAADSICEFRRFRSGRERKKKVD
jgi:hypothetical protein